MQRVSLARFGVLSESVLAKIKKLCIDRPGPIEVFLQALRGDTAGGWPVRPEGAWPLHGSPLFFPTLSPDVPIAPTDDPENQVFRDEAAGLLGLVLQTAEPPAPAPQGTPRAQTLCSSGSGAPGGSVSVRSLQRLVTSVGAMDPDMMVDLESLFASPARVGTHHTPFFSSTSLLVMGA